jgi:hypothetical protein
MKKTALFLLMLFAIQVSQAQVSFGLRGGLNFSRLPSESVSFNSIENVQSEIKTISDSYTGFHVGLMGEVSLLGIFIMPELLFVNSGNYLVVEQGDTRTDVIQKFSQIDIPVMVGTKIGPLRAGIGPVATIMINSDSNMSDDFAFKERFNSATYGFQLGAGVTLGNIALDLKYQFGLSSLGDGIQLGDNTYEFDTRPRQLVFSVGLLLF